MKCKWTSPWLTSAYHRALFHKISFRRADRLTYARTHSHSRDWDIARTYMYTQTYTDGDLCIKSTNKRTRGTQPLCMYSKRLITISDPVFSHIFNNLIFFIVSILNLIILNGKSYFIDLEVAIIIFSVTKLNAVSLRLKSTNVHVRILERSFQV